MCVWRGGEGERGGVSVGGEGGGEGREGGMKVRVRGG